MDAACTGKDEVDGCAMNLIAGRFMAPANAMNTERLRYRVINVLLIRHNEE